MDEPDQAMEKIRRDQALKESPVDQTMRMTRQVQMPQEVTAPTRERCVFCEEGHSLTRIGNKGICSSCSEKLMKALLKTREWKDASKSIAKAI